MSKPAIQEPEKVRFARQFTSGSLPDEAAFHESSNEEVNEHSISIVASIGKTFVAGVILQLAQENFFGKKGIDTRIVDILKDKKIAEKFFSGANRDATIADLLSHTGGLGDFFTPDFVKKIESNLAAPSTVAESLEYSIVGEDGVQLNQEGKPIEYGKPSYSNTGYVILGQIIEEVTGNHWSREIEDRFINPKKGRGAENAAPVLTDTTTVWTMTAAMKERVVPTTYDCGDGNSQDPSKLKAIHAAGGFFSSTSDLTQFARNFFKGIGSEQPENNNPYFNSATVSRMRESALDGKPLGCGAAVDKEKNEILNLGQSGAIFGGGASMRYDPATDSTRVTIAAADNLHPYKTREVTKEKVIETDEKCDGIMQQREGSWAKYVKGREENQSGKKSPELTQ